MNEEIEKLIDDHIHQAMSVVEEKLILNVEKIEGRVPSNEEVIKHGRVQNYPNGQSEWLWKNQAIVRWRYENGKIYVSWMNTPKSN